MSIHPTILADITAERERQIRKGYDANHDDSHSEGTLLVSATYIAAPGHSAYCEEDMEEMGLAWAHRAAIKYENSPYRRTIIAAAMLLAEAERLKRAEEAGTQSESDSD